MRLRAIIILAPYVRELIGRGHSGYHSLSIRIPCSWLSPKRWARRWWNCIPARIATQSMKAALDDAAHELTRLQEAADAGEELGLEVHAGHGIGFDTVGPIAEIPQLVELNIGHFLIGEAIFGGLDSAIRRMRALMDQARNKVTGQVSA